jgi:hypothetical protein
MRALPILAAFGLAVPGLAALGLAGLLAGPALAQTAPPPAVFVPGPLAPPAATWQFNAFLVQQEQARLDAIRQQNDLMRLEGQARTEQAIAAIQAQRNAPRLPPPDVSGPPPYPQLDTSDLPAISDKALAESNRRVLDAAGDGR